MGSGMVGTAPSTTTLTMPDGSTIMLADWIDDKLYGSVQLVNGQTGPVEAYSTARSMPIPGGQRIQTGVDTNIPRAGDNGLPKDWEMLVYGWGAQVTRVMRAPDGAPFPVLPDSYNTNVPFPTPASFVSSRPFSAPSALVPPYALSNVPSLNTLFQIDRVIQFAFEYNAKIYTKGTLQDYPPGHGYNMFTTNGNTELAQNGLASPRDRVALVLPIHQRENLGFKCILQPQAPVAIVQFASDNSTGLNFADVKYYSMGLIKRTVV
jgi:hypothetical protein